MNLVDFTLEGFSSEVASSSPAPGGGSVAAYAGSQGYALVAMVCRLTIGREKYAMAEEQMKALLDTAEDKAERLLSLVDQDTLGFKAVMDALSLPKTTDEEKSKRRQAMENATYKAAEIPLQTAKLCLEGLREIPKLLETANPNALSDMGVAAIMFKAGLDGALYNVRINAVNLKEAENKRDLLIVADAFAAEGNSMASAIAQTVNERLR